MSNLDEFYDALNEPPGCSGGHAKPVRERWSGGHIVIDGERVDIMNGVCAVCRATVRMRRDGTCIAHRRGKN